MFAMHKSRFWLQIALLLRALSFIYMWLRAISCVKRHMWIHVMTSFHAQALHVNSCEVVYMTTEPSTCETFKCQIISREKLRLISYDKFRKWFPAVKFFHMLVLPHEITCVNLPALYALHAGNDPWSILQFCWYKTLLWNCKTVYISIQY